MTSRSDTRVVSSSSRPSSTCASVSRLSTVRLMRSTSSRALSRTSRASSAEVGVPQAHVELGAHDRQRRAQLVRGVGDQAVLLAHAALQAIEHRVERHRQAAELVGGARHRDALVEAVDADLARVRRHPLDRPQRLARQPVARQRRRGERDRAGQQEQHEHAAHGVLHRRQRLRDDQHAALARPP